MSQHAIQIIIYGDLGNSIGYFWKYHILLKSSSNSLQNLGICIVARHYDEEKAPQSSLEEVAKTPSKIC